MRSYQVRRRILAAPDIVWRILTDGDALVAAGAGVLSLEGRVGTGERLRLVLAASPNRAFELTVTECEPTRRLVWEGGMPLGLFRGVRTFTLDPAGPATDFTMREDFSGPLAGLIGRAMPDLSASFDQFANGVKRASEAGA